MPPISPPCLRERVEALLSPRERASLLEFCRLLQIPPERWHYVSAFAVSFETVAAARMAERLETEQGLSIDAALTRAAVHLGLDPSTVKSRTYRWHRQARGALSCITHWSPFGGCERLGSPDVWNPLGEESNNG